MPSWNQPQSALDGSASVTVYFNGHGNDEGHFDCSNPDIANKAKAGAVGELHSSTRSDGRSWKRSAE